MTETAAKAVKAEPHEFVPPVPGTRNAEFGWCAREDCGFTADAYVHASEEERRRFDSQRARPRKREAVTSHGNPLAEISGGGCRVRVYEEVPGQFTVSFSQSPGMWASFTAPAESVHLVGDAITEALAARESREGDR